MDSLKRPGPLLIEETLEILWTSDILKSMEMGIWRAISDKFGHWNAVMSTRQILSKYQKDSKK
jgi:hypothetical protein